MELSGKIDKNVRNLSLLLILIGVILLLIWLIIYILTPHQENALLMALGIGILLGGLLVLTRVQYIIWLKKKVSSKN
jgi:hypothetical protein